MTYHGLTEESECIQETWGQFEVSERREREISRWLKVVHDKPTFSSVRLVLLS